MMDLYGGYVIPAGVEAVWTALSDVQRIEAALPHAATLTDLGFDRFAAAAQPGADGSGRRYRATVALSEREAPKSCRIKGEGSDDESRTATLEGKVELLPDGPRTRLVYALRIAASEGDRPIDPAVIDATARPLLTAFIERVFASFGEVAALDPANGKLAPHPRDGLPPLLWASGLLALIAVLLFLSHLIGRP